MADNDTWKPEADEIAKRGVWAEQLGGVTSVERHHQHGRLTVRERIQGLVDANSFREIGKLAGQAVYSRGKVERVTPSPYVMGLARIGGRAVALGGEDFTVKGGAATGSERRKGGRGGFVEDLAYEYRIPLVNLIVPVIGTAASVHLLHRAGDGSRGELRG